MGVFNLTGHRAVKLPVGSSDPGYGAGVGDIYYNNVSNKFLGYNSSGYQRFEMAPNIVADQLVHSWDAGDGASSTSTWVDSVGGWNLTGSNVGYTADNGGQFTFNGSSSKFSFPSVTISTSGIFTVEIWFKTSSSSAYQNLLDMTDSTGGIWISTNAGSLHVSPDTGAHKVSSSYSINTWYHVVAVYNSGTFYMYLNSALIGSASGTFSNTSYNTLNFAGARVGNVDGDRASEYLAGSMSIIRFYGKALSASEILQNWSADKTRFGY